jgi:hypothetical protein
MVVVCEHDSVQVLGELFGIGVGAKLSLLDPVAERPREDVNPLALQRHQCIAHRSRPIVQLARRRHEHAAAGQYFRLLPGQPALEQRPHPGSAPPLPQGRPDDLIGEPGRGMLEDFYLQGFLGAEMGEQPALGEPKVVGQAADGEARQADLAGEAGGVAEDALAGGGALGRAAKIARPFVLSISDIATGSVTHPR